MDDKLCAREGVQVRGACVSHRPVGRVGCRRSQRQGEETSEGTFAPLQVRVKLVGDQNTGNRISCRRADAVSERRARSH